MPLDADRVALCREWLAIASSDLRAALVLRQASPPSIHQALYLCQPCGEKTLKAFLIWHDLPLMKIHDLKVLSIKCAEIDASLGSQLLQADSLTAYGSMYRYPGGSEIEASAQDAEDAHQCASDIMRTILSRLPKEVAP